MVFAARPNEYRFRSLSAGSTRKSLGRAAWYGIDFRTTSRATASTISPASDGTRPVRG